MKILIIKNNKTIGNYKSTSTAAHALKLQGLTTNQVEQKISTVKRNEISEIRI